MWIKNFYSSSICSIDFCREEIYVQIKQVYEKTSEAAIIPVETEWALY